MSVEIYRRSPSSDSAHVEELKLINGKLFVKLRNYQDKFAVFLLLAQDGLKEKKMNLWENNMKAVNLEDLCPKEKKIVFEYLISRD